MNNKGFSLIEVMTSLVLFGIVLSGMLPAFLSYIQYNTQSEIRTEAIMVAQQTLDEIRVIDPVTLPTSGTNGPDTVTVGDRSFEVTTSYCLEASFCASVNNRHITVAINYKGKPIYDVETVFTQLR